MLHIFQLDNKQTYSFCNISSIIPLLPSSSFCSLRSRLISPRWLTMYRCSLTFFVNFFDSFCTWLCTLVNASLPWCTIPANSSQILLTFEEKYKFLKAHPYYMSYSLLLTYTYTCVPLEWGIELFHIFDPLEWTATSQVSTLLLLETGQETLVPCDNETSDHCWVIQVRIYVAKHSC